MYEHKIFSYIQWKILNQQKQPRQTTNMGEIMPLWVFRHFTVRAGNTPRKHCDSETQ